MTFSGDPRARPRRSRARRAASGPGRPRLLIAAWIVLMGIAAGVVPALQAALGVPWDALALITLAPALVSGVLWIVARSWFPPPWPPMTWPAVGGPVLLAALFGVVHLGVVCLCAHRPPSVPTALGGAPLGLYLLLQTGGALAEEIGWRGVLQRAGEEFMRPTASAALFGLLFGLTHLGYWSLGGLFVALFGLSSMFMVLAISAIWSGGFWQRLIPATLVHVFVNLGLASVTVNPAATSPWLLPLPALAGLLVVAPLGRRLRRRRSLTMGEPGDRGVPDGTTAATDRRAVPPSARQENR